MRYLVRDIVREVRIHLDLDAEDLPLVHVPDAQALTVDAIVRSLIVQGATQVICEAPLSKLQTGVPVRGGVAWRDAPGVGMGLLLLPDDFLRLIALRMSDWQRDAKIISAHDAEYQWQSSRFPGVRGNPQRPVVAVVSTPAGWAAELYTSQAGPGVTLSKALYQPVPVIRHDAIELPPLLFHEVIDRIADLVRRVFEASPNGPR